MNAALRLNRNQLRTALRTPALRFFLTVWAASTLFLLARGQLNAFLVAYSLGVFGLTGATILITPAPPADEASAPAERRRLWFQVVFLLLIIALTAIGGMVFHNVVYWRVPIWTDMFDLVESFAVTAGVRNPNYISNPLAYFVIPLIGLLLLGARWRTLGFELVQAQSKPVE